MFMNFYFITTILGSGYLSKWKVNVMIFKNLWDSLPLIFYNSVLLFLFTHLFFLIIFLIPRHYPSIINCIIVEADLKHRLLSDLYKHKHANACVSKHTHIHIIIFTKYLKIIYTLIIM